MAIIRNVRFMSESIHDFGPRPVEGQELDIEGEIVDIDLYDDLAEIFIDNGDAPIEMNYDELEYLCIEGGKVKC